MPDRFDQAATALAQAILSRLAFEAQSDADEKRAISLKVSREVDALCTVLRDEFSDGLNDEVICSRAHNIFTRYRTEGWQYVRLGGEEYNDLFIQTGGFLSATGMRDAVAKGIPPLVLAVAITKSVFSNHRLPCDTQAMPVFGELAGLYRHILIGPTNGAPVETVTVS